MRFATSLCGVNKGETSQVLERHLAIRECASDVFRISGSLRLIVSNDYPDVTAVQPCTGDITFLNIGGPCHEVFT